MRTAMSSHVVWAGLLVVLAMGCSSRPKKDDREDQRQLSRPTAPAVPLDSHDQAFLEGRPISDTHPYQINDYLIVPVKWQRAEDAAVTLEPLIQARYGPDARVIVHHASNKLLIYAPRRNAWSRGSGQRGASPQAGRGSTRNSTMGGSTTRGGSTRGSTTGSSTRSRSTTSRR